MHTKKWERWTDGRGGRGKNEGSKRGKDKNEGEKREVEEEKRDEIFPW